MLQSDMKGKAQAETPDKAHLSVCLTACLSVCLSAASGVLVVAMGLLDGGRLRLCLVVEVAPVADVVDVCPGAAAEVGIVLVLVEVWV